MSPWTVVGWCFAVCSVIVTVFVVGTTVGALSGLTIVFFGKTDMEKRLAKIKKEEEAKK